MTDSPSLQSAPDTATSRTSPRGEARRRRQREVAREHFLQNGYAATSINEIAREAGGSLTTLYRNFGNKEGLFLAVMQQEAQSVWSVMDHEVNEARRVDEALEHFGMAMLTLALEPQLIRLFRGLAFESGRNPQLGKLFLDNGPKLTRQRLAGYLARQVAEGHLPGSGLGQEPLAAANLLTGMLLNPLHVDALLGSFPEPADPESLRPHVRRCVRVFIAGFGA
ncbi:TetR/AcrR family transcriptional regulator [Cobetia marina]|uniref:TetR/AcrR family transcriptional regulator n=1 Tax=Cobetia marina TaxID=28258 RepID=UPI002547E889|nr:TetR/AcrR family transcriptional regulator [Cobetia pacifica]MDI6003078.1 TetR/AcrR family transcriptional regulator [Cobetia pacifica]